jgi:hypothetical protein
MAYPMENRGGCRERAPRIRRYKYPDVLRFRMIIPRLTLAGVLLLLVMVSFAGCTDLQPGSGNPVTPTSSPEARIQETAPPVATPAPEAPPGPATGGTPAPAVTPASERPEPLAPEPKPTLRIAPTFQVEPLTEVTGDAWESYSTFPQYPFEYRSLGYILWVPYNTAAYEQAKKMLPARNDLRNLEFSQLKTISPDWWYLSLPPPGQQVYWRNLINDPANDLPYDSILTRMREIRDEYQLDDNEYAELIARFVQRSIPDRSWQADERVVERYPIETIGDFGGNRVDKSLLLAGLLAREGYDVALIYFPDVNGMLVGIRGDGKAAEYDGYLGIDPSSETFFGVYAPKAAPIIPGVQYFADYKVVKVSDGKGYTTGLELRLIWDRLLYMTFYESLHDYARDLRFVHDNRDNRQLVFEYLAYLGPFA